jgi:hypothetical protein
MLTHGTCAGVFVGAEGSSGHRDDRLYESKIVFLEEGTVSAVGYARNVVDRSFSLSILTFVADDETLITDEAGTNLAPSGIEAGSYLQVVGQLLPDGTTRASMIRISQDDDAGV